MFYFIICPHKWRAGKILRQFGLNSNSPRYLVLTLLVSSAVLWGYSVVLSCDIIPSYCYVWTLYVASYKVLTCCFLLWYTLSCCSLQAVPLLISVMFQVLQCNALSWQPGLLRWQGCQAMSRNCHHTTITILLSPLPCSSVYNQLFHQVSSSTTSHSTTFPPLQPATVFHQIFLSATVYSTMFPPLQLATPLYFPL